MNAQVLKNIYNLDFAITEDKRAEKSVSTTSEVEKMSKMNFIKVHCSFCLSLVIAVYYRRQTPALRLTGTRLSDQSQLGRSGVVVFRYGVLSVLDTLGIEIGCLPKASLPSLS